MDPQPLIEVITEEEFLPLAHEPCGTFFRMFNAFITCLKEGKEINRKFYSDLMIQAEHLECFLDGHGARENKRWAFFSEYVASIRNLGISAFYIKHVVDRFPHYNLREDADSQQRFYSEAAKTLMFLNHSIANLYRETAATGQANGLTIPDGADCPREFSELESNKRLPRNISEDVVRDEEDSIIELCDKIKKVASMMRDIPLPKAGEKEELIQWVPTRLNEKKTRMFQNLVHSVQSEFDTYVKNTRLEHQHPELKVLRGNISACLHLLEGILWMCHFYERHEDEIRHSDSKRRIALMVDKYELLDRIFHFGLRYSLHFINKAHQMAEEVLTIFVKTVRAEVPVPKPLGFHARPSTYISLIARHYDEDLFLLIDEEKINAKSVMSLLQAGGLIADKGYETVTFEGGGHIIEDVKTLAKHNYCENGEIPRSLAYLRDSKSGG